MQCYLTYLSTDSARKHLKKKCIASGIPHFNIIILKCGIPLRLGYSTTL